MNICACVHAQSLSRIQLSATPWIVVCLAPLSMEFSRQEHWSGLPFSSPEDLPDPGIEPASPAGYESNLYIYFKLNMLRLL